MSTTIPDGVALARDRRRRTLRNQVNSLNLDGDEARYVVAFMRWRLKMRATRPGVAYWLGEGWDARRATRLENAADALLELAGGGRS